MNVIAYVDGSFNAVCKVYGSGVVLFVEGKAEPYKESISGADPIFAKSNNVAGEVFAAIRVFDICKLLGKVDQLTLYYDYNGIEAWYHKNWKANSPIAQHYMKAAAEVPYPIIFKKVKAHSGDTYNDEADRLAKEGCGL